MSDRAAEASTAKTNRYFNSYDVNVNHKFKLPSDTNMEYFTSFFFFTEGENGVWVNKAGRSEAI